MKPADGHPIPRTAAGRCRVAAAAVLVLVAAAGARAEEQHRICRFVLAEEQIERDDLELQFDLARSEFAAAEEIFALVDSLWKNDAIERILYLRAKHDRDATRIDVERLRFLVERQDAVIEHYRQLCAVLVQGDDSAERARSLESAYRRYRGAHCTVMRQEVALAEVDQVYLKEVLESVRDLRRGGVATRQAIVRAERNVEMAQKRLKQGSERLERCRAEIAARGGSGAP